MRLEEITVQQPDVFDVSKNRATQMGVEISHLRRAVFAEEMIRAGISPAAVHEHTRDWKAYDMAKALHNKVVESDNHFVRAATHSGFVVGYCLGNMRREAGHKELSVVQLYPEVRRHGLGSLLIQRFAEYNPVDGDAALPMKLSVLADNVDAQGFYGAQGFEFVPDDKAEPFDIAGEFAPVLRMHREPLQGPRPEVVVG